MMHSTVLKVFMLVGLLVVIFIAWQLTFNDGGILRTGYNSVASGINEQWAKVAGENSTLIAMWGSSACDNGKNLENVSHGGGGHSR